jgi:two-component system response regulator FlrC
LFVNGQKCEVSQLRVGDVIRCGEWIAVLTDNVSDVPFREISPGWHGSAKLQDAVGPTSRVSADLPIIVQGETGTGKEGLARTVHLQSGRSGAFIAVNCATLPVHLAESELFGHRRGAFTGADKASTGLFRAAHHGTLFLDEIQELPPVIQPKLLRVLEQREVLPVGETSPVPIDTRIVVATQEPLQAAVATGKFRADLYARLDGLTVVLPPLRHRREDIAPLFLKFLRQEAGGAIPVLDAKLVESLCLYDWPLNVRELFLLSKRLLGLFSAEPIIKREFLPDRILKRTTLSVEEVEVQKACVPKRAWRSTNDDSEFEALVAALRTLNGNVLKASEALGISRSRAYRLLSAKGFDVDRLRGST